MAVAEKINMYFYSPSPPVHVRVPNKILSSIGNLNMGANINKSTLHLGEIMGKLLMPPFSVSTLFLRKSIKVGHLVKIYEKQQDFLRKCNANLNSVALKVLSSADGDHVARRNICK